MAGYRRILVTSALPYANGPLHIGHVAGAYLPADIYTRFQRLKGEEVIHISGTDEHGVAVTISAEKQKKSPKEVVDYYHREIKEAFNELLIEFDNFSRTTKPLHYKLAQNFFLRLYEKSLIYKKENEQFYCPNCKRFLPDRYVEGTCPYCGYEKARGDQCDKCGRWLEPTQLINPRCAICGSTPILKKTFHYYFKLSEFEKPLKEWLESKEHWKPNVRQLALNWIKEGLKDRAITRDLEWGVPVPLEEAKNKVLYVWFDAPIGYISSTIEWAQKIGDENKWKDYWLSNDTKLVHFIGKDNIVFHAIVWPAMLMAHGEYILPSDIPANEFLNLMGDKMSTSRNYAIWIKDLTSRFHPDMIRIGLAMALPEIKDSDFSPHEFRRFVNAELINNYSNFVNRTLSFIKKYLGGKIPNNGIEEEVLNRVKEASSIIAELLEKFEFKKALKEIFLLSDYANAYFDRSKPWEKRKVSIEETGKVLANCVYLVKALSIFMFPYAPKSSTSIWQILGEEKFNWGNATDGKIPWGYTLGKVKPLFKKIEEKEVTELIELVLSRAGKTKEEGKEMEKISYEEFSKLDIRIGTILSAEPIEGADRLYRLEVDLGDKKVTLVAGIKKAYPEPEKLIGKQVPVLANLEPRKIRGILSQGMILAAVEDGVPVLLHPDRKVKEGTKVS